jgi:hypothetical protein
MKRVPQTPANARADAPLNRPQENASWTATAPARRDEIARKYTQCSCGEVPPLTPPALVDDPATKLPPSAGVVDRETCAFFSAASYSCPKQSCVTLEIFKASEL